MITTTLPGHALVIIGVFLNLTDRDLYDDPIILYKDLLSNNIISDYAETSDKSS